MFRRRLKADEIRGRCVSFFACGEVRRGRLASKSSSSSSLEYVRLGDDRTYSSISISGGVGGRELESVEVGVLSSVHVDESESERWRRRGGFAAAVIGVEMRNCGRGRLRAMRGSWWARISSSVIRSSKSKTSRNSRSIRPTSRLLNSPVHIDQWTFFNVESFRY